MAAYISNATADGLLTHQVAWSTLTEPVKTASIEAATRYIDALYGSVYIGTITSTAQDNLWPRSATVDKYGREILPGSIPMPLQRAVAELGFLVATGNILLPTTVSSGSSTTSTTASGVLTQQTAKVGSLESTKKYSAGGTTTAVATGVKLATESGIPLIPLVEAEMSALIGSSGTTANNYRILRS